MQTLLQNLRYTTRALRKSPGFTAVAVITLALRIGANTAIFSVVNAVLLRPLPYKDDSGLVVILNKGRNPVAPANFIDWRSQSQSFSQMGGGRILRLRTLHRHRQSREVVGLPRHSRHFSNAGCPALVGTNVPANKRLA